MSSVRKANLSQRLAHLPATDHVGPFGRPIRQAVVGCELDEIHGRPEFIPLHFEVNGVDEVLHERQ